MSILYENEANMSFSKFDKPKQKFKKKKYSQPPEGINSLIILVVLVQYLNIASKTIPKNSDPEYLSVR